jgi:hypothetical protein
MANQSHGGNVRDPEHDGRLKENREAGRTKGTTPGSQARAEDRGHDPSSRPESHSSHSTGPHSSASRRASHEGSHGSSHEGGSHLQGGSEDLKSREYRDSQGEVHHHTKTYAEQHGSKK